MDNKLVLHIGILQKMRNELASPAKYWLPLEPKPLLLNDYLGQEIALQHTGKINCIACDKLINKSYQHGYCYHCMQTLARCDLCIVKPELCHYQQGTCREPNWGKEHCLAPHIVYLANSSAVKVGVTREAQIPTRWLDQGATQALPILRTKTRYQAGLLEVLFAKQMPDKTNWRKMLQGAAVVKDLAIVRDELFHKQRGQLQSIAGLFPFGDIELLTAEKTIDISYPVLEYPQKITALNFDKTPEITGVLLGVKGQYLILTTGVVNIRNFAGYEVKFSLRQSTITAGR
jgi:hypothetical protein